jgi:hypothetical protein
VAKGLRLRHISGFLRRRVGQALNCQIQAIKIVICNKGLGILVIDIRMPRGVGEFIVVGLLTYDDLERNLCRQV